MLQVMKTDVHETTATAILKKTMTLVRGGAVRCGIKVSAASGCHVPAPNLVSEWNSSAGVCRKGAAKEDTVDGRKAEEEIEEEMNKEFVGRFCRENAAEESGEKETAEDESAEEATGEIKASELITTGT